MVKASLHNHPLTTSAALVWSGDPPRLLQQMLFQAADSLTTGRPRPQPRQARQQSAEATKEPRPTTKLAQQ